MKIKPNLIQIYLLGALTLGLPSAVQAQFQWAQRIASTTSWPDDIPNTGLALDTNDNCYVTGFFDDTNDFGGVTLTNQSVGGQDIFVAKYNPTGALQWAQRAGGTTINTGRAIGVDTNGNIYVTGGYGGAAKFGGITLPSASGEEFYLAKYNNAGTVQWVQASANGSSSVDGLGLAVDSAGNSYALVSVDDLGGSATSITFGSKTVNIPAANGSPVMILVKYDNTGTAQWAQLMGGSDEIYATKVAVDAAGNAYVRGTFYATLTIGASNLTVSPPGTSKNMFLAKFNNSGTLTWLQQAAGGNVDEGGVAVDPAGNVYTTGAFNTNLDFGSGITLTNGANSSALFGDAFLAKYNSAGTIQWAQPAGGTNGGLYWDVALDTQTNIYAGGFLGYDAAVAKYNPAGMLQWIYSASGPSASPVSSSVSKCAIDSTGHCYLSGFYQGTNTFGTTTLQPQETFNFFLTETATNPTIQFIASPTSGTPPLAVQFNSTNVDSLGNVITSWNWNFGDGGTSTLQNPSYTYTNSGTFTPSLIAMNNNGAAVTGFGPQIVTTPVTSPTDFTFIIHNGTITITGYTGSNTVVNIPRNINGLPVTVIGNGSDQDFVFPPGVTSVTIPDSVTIIANHAFDSCYTLTSVTIPNSVTGFGEWAFSDCNLTNITIPNSVTSLGDGVFNGCPFTSVPIGVNITSIVNDEFRHCDSLTSVSIPSNVTSIGSTAFGGCPNLTNVMIPKSVTSIGNSAFANCGPMSVYFQGNAPSADSTVFSGDTGTVYYLPGTSGWYSPFGSLPAVELNTLFVQYTAMPNNGIVPLTVNFTSPGIDSSNNIITSWNWTFGDGSTSTAQNPSHVYVSAGTFQPGLVATNVLGVPVSSSGPTINVAAAGNIVSNGGFETGDFTGWILSGDTSPWTFVDDGSASGIQPHSGGYVAELGTTSALGFVTQTLSTVPGQSYLISLWLNSPDGLTPNEFLVNWNGNTIFDQVDMPALGWTNIQFVVAATGASTVLQFGFQDDPSYLGLDDISVVSLTITPPPVILSTPQLTVGKTNFLFQLAGPSGSNYVLQVSTNLLNWNSVSTSTIPISGSITLTNAISGYNRQFYRTYLK